ncbi:LytTR family DNA-binding domain-containing protein [Dyella psychrodurans]|uniref:LytTR family transcriptional regulator n=1 Tax=Dyella psychrodurans TaxID=1927960 RepID=A0A370X4J7_9GAMM|nr:LytTR family DNA-binding domain-containing protein [Dyella psychrodurans]RDS83318.1 LytTR family transcriptional regulator [Dyella psychrodurans]
MGTSRGFTFESFQRWRRSFEIAFWPAFFVLNTVFNGEISVMDHPRVQWWEPWVWEASSSTVMLALVPALVTASRRWPIRIDTWQRNLPLHLMFSVVFSAIHVAGMVGLRMLAYAMAGQHYDFGAWATNFAYEYLKDGRSYFWILVTIGLYRFWVMRLQGEASLLEEPDVGPPVEPVEQPERFLVRKLGKEFLLAAREIEWLQASGNYVNLHVRGRDYPLRATMAGIETRLDAQHFVRVHRSYVINLDFLAEIEPLDTGDARLLMRDGVKIPCSRRYRAMLRERFGQPTAA